MLSCYKQIGEDRKKKMRRELRLCVEQWKKCEMKLHVKQSKLWTKKHLFSIC